MDIHVHLTICMMEEGNLVTDRPTSWMQRETGIAVDLANDGRSRSAARLKYSLNDGGSWRQQRIPGKIGRRWLFRRFVSFNYFMDDQQICVQGRWGGYGKKLSSSQAQLGQATCLAVAYFLFFPFPVGHPPHPPCSWWPSHCVLPF